MRRKQGLDPIGADTVLYFNTGALVDSIADPLDRKSKMGYDAHGNVAWVQSPVGIRKRQLRDYLGRDTLVVTPFNDSGDSLRVRTGYDVLGRTVFSVTRNDLDAKWDSVASTYDPITGDLIKVEVVGGATSSPTDSNAWGAAWETVKRTFSLQVVPAGRRAVASCSR